MGSLDTLKTEITVNPLNRPYDSMTDIEVANDLNTVYRERNKTSLTGSEVLNAVVASEWAVLTDAQKQEVWNIVHLGDVNPFGVEATLLIGVFGAGSDTITALATIRKEDISRAIELGHSFIYPGQIENARY